MIKRSCDHAWLANIWNRFVYVATCPRHHWVPPPKCSVHQWPWCWFGWPTFAIKASLGFISIWQDMFIRWIWSWLKTDMGSLHMVSWWRSIRCRHERQWLTPLVLFTTDLAHLQSGPKNEAIEKQNTLNILKHLSPSLHILIAHYRTRLHTWVYIPVAHLHCTTFCEQIYQNLITKLWNLITKP